MTDLYSPFALGGLELPNRLVMAPMTRARCGADRAPADMHARYYAQRATAGLIVTEGIHPAPGGIGFLGSPGLYEPEQVAGWRAVTAAVHAAGGRVFAQLWHVGRASHASLLGGEPPVAPSAVAGTGEVYTADGKVPMGEPRALSTAEVGEVVAEFGRAAANAKAAGFDGVELHGANGYLIEQFLVAGANRRTDRYGGGVENRVRFLLELVEAAAAHWPAGRVGVRVSPNNRMAGIDDPDRAGLYGHVADALSPLGLAYLHVVEPLPGHPFMPPEMQVPPERRLSALLRARYRGTLIANGGYDRDSGDRAVRDGEADLVSFGLPFLANPDLPARYRTGAVLNAPDPATLYVPGEKGYTDYPALADGGVTAAYAGAPAGTTSA